MGALSIADLVITVAYFSIPIQILASLWKYPRMANMPAKIVLLLILFALFIFLCGAGHLLRCLERTSTYMFLVVNTLTSIVSSLTAIYLLPLIPNLLSTLDQSLAELVELNQEAEESKAKLFTFMAFLCHEIRNPLFAITSSANFLGDTNLTVEQSDGVDSIFDSSMLMLRLVNDVLDLSKIDAGKLELEERYFDFHRLLENLDANMRLQIAHQRKQRQLQGAVRHYSNDGITLSPETTLISRIAPDVPRVIFADSIRILQIIYNLLSNASKYTSHGHIELSVGVCGQAQQANSRMSRAGNDHDDPAKDHISNSSPKQFSVALLNDMELGLDTSSSDKRQAVNTKIVDTRPEVTLTIAVTDTGVGIPQDRLKVIFEPYSQAKLSDYRKHGGTGLGLSILANLTKLMGGTIDVQSTVGEGSMFLLRLPVRVSDDQTICESLLNNDEEEMSDPMLACRRLPVYKSPAGEDEKQRETFIASAPFPPAQKASSASMNSTKKSLSMFSFPPNSCKVLVVDDNVINRKIIGKMLTFFGVEFELAANGDEAINILQNSRNVTGNLDEPYFALVFMDLYMPIMDGYEAIDTLRRQNITVPIIALTANALTQERIKAISLGATEFHTKPILRGDIHAICSRFLRLNPDTSPLPTLL